MSKAEELKRQIEVLQNELEHVLMEGEKQRVKVESCSAGELVDFLKDVPREAKLCFHRGDWGIHPVIKDVRQIFYYHEKDGVVSIKATAPRGVNDIKISATDMIRWRP